LPAPPWRSAGSGKKSGAWGLQKYVLESGFFYARKAASQHLETGSKNPTFSTVYL
jgi:hypothetical protein